MKAEIIAVGDPAKNQSFFDIARQITSRELSTHGAVTSDYTQTPASGEQLYTVLSEATRHSDIIVILAAAEVQAVQVATSVVCSGLELPVKIRRDCIGFLTDYAAHTGHLLTQDERSVFAAAPEGAVSFGAPDGLVQGYAVRARRQMLLILPAVPSQLSRIFHDPAFTALFSVPMQPSAAPTETVSRSIILKAAQLGETSVQELLSQSAFPAGIRIDCSQEKGDWRIRLTASGSSRAEADALLQQSVAAADTALGSLLYSHTDETIAQTAVCALAGIRQRVTIADAGGGALNALLAGAQGSGKVAAVIPALSDTVKVKTLGVSQKLLSEKGAVSRSAAASMAMGSRRHGKTELGAAIVGGTTNAGTVAGLFYIALADDTEVWVKKLQIDPAGDPEILQNLACMQLFNMLRLYVLEYPGKLPGGVSVPSGRAAFALPLLGKKRAAPAAAKASEKVRTGKEKNGMNLFQKLRRGQLDKSDKIRVGVLALCVVVFLVCVIYIISVKLESVNYKKNAESMAGVYYGESVDRNSVPGYPKNYIDKFVALWQQNDDVAGWINIPDTLVDYVVVQALDNTTYERTDFYRKSNQHGVPFVDFRVDQEIPSTNTIIFGHNMDDGQIFGPLLNYKSLAYYKEHPLINYDSVYRTGQYKIFGVVLCKKDDPDFNYHNFIDKNDLADTGFSSLSDYVAKIRERSLINTKVDVQETDTLLTLSTCDYSFRDENGNRIARFVIFARRVRDGESTAVDTAGATLNTNPVMPAEWYADLAKKQQAELEAQQQAEAENALKQWLTADELAEYDAETQKAIAESRKAKAALYLTYDEQNEDLETRLSLMNQRETLFTRYLSSDEQKWSSVTKKIETAEEREAEALRYLTEAEISSAKTWSRISALIEERKAAADDFAKWLTADERNSSSLTYAQKAALVSSRKAQASAAGLTSSEIASASNWAEIQQLIAAKQGNAALQSLVADNPRWLTSADITSSATEASLRQLIETRKARAAAAGVDPSLYSTWTELSKAIDAAESAATAQIQAQIENYFNENYPLWLEQSDKPTTYTQSALTHLQNLVSQHKSEAAGAGVNGNNYATWAEIQAAIAAASSASPSSASSSSESNSPESSSSQESSSSENLSSESSVDPTSVSDIPPT